MQINDKNTPADYPTNELTLMIEAVAQRNRGGYLPPSRGEAIMASPQPMVRSAELGRPVVEEDDPNRPLSAEEVAELDRQAIASGLITGPVTRSIGARLESGDDTGPYGTLEDAIRAGAPISVDEATAAQGAERFREPAPPPIRTAIGARAPRQTAREFIAAQPEAQLPRLPDFRKVQMIDLVNGKVYVDGLEFSLTVEQLKMLRKFSVTIAKEQIQKSLDTALAALEVDDGGDAGATQGSS